MKKTLFSVLFIITFFCTLIAQNIPMRENYIITMNASGDLDNDGISELVVAYDLATDRKKSNSTRELIIYKEKNNQWMVWKTSKQALYGIDEGGQMGDPLVGMEIKKGVLSIVHYGGSSWKWGQTDKYRFQEGEFFLIGYKSLSGKLCEYWEKVDFNLSTGKMVVTKEYEDCGAEATKIYKKENETIFEKGLKISLQKRREKEIAIITPKYKHKVYVANK
ncbi:hypothetical protein [Aquimarina sp. SS2-1]|uniref:hypothetical protein n=1 Tax=Aquimarina besae TaxID=3342247 RepID=UPI00366D958B